MSGDTARRDRYGRYLVVPPEGGQPIAYRRMTTIAKILDSGGGLTPWKATATMVGALRRQGLLASWQALVAEHPDPWYDTEASKKRCKKLVEDCATAGGSSDRADIGTALHAIIETGARSGWTTPPLAGSLQADVDAYRTTLDAAGIVIDPDFVESRVVLDALRIAGTSDNLRLLLPGYGPVCADLKTGADLRYSWQSIAIQLAGYVHADHVYVQGEAPDGSGDRRLAMPAVSQEWGLVIHLPAGEARCTLHLVDLAAGWEMLQRSLDVEIWRKRSDLAKRWTPNTLIGDDFDMPQQPALPDGASPAVQAAGEVDDFDLPMVPAAAPPAAAAAPPVDRRAEISERMAASPVMQMIESARQSTATTRPALPTHPDEGDDWSGRPVWDDLQARFTALRDGQRAWFGGLIRQALAAGADFHARIRTERRRRLYDAIITLCEHGQDEDEVVRALVALVLGDDAPLHLAIHPGHAVGSLGADQAATLQTAVERFVAQRLEPVIGDDGALRLVVA